jgi:hypothetical protein
MIQIPATVFLKGNIRAIHPFALFGPAQLEWWRTTKTILVDGYFLIYD